MALLETVVIDKTICNMGVIANKLKNIIKFDLNRSTKEAIDRNKQKIGDLNKQQLNDGMKADGTDMPLYSTNSLRIKQATGIRVPSNKAFSLKQTGKLHDGIFVKAESTFFEISSSDPALQTKLHDQVFRSKELEDKDAFGLTPNNKEILVDLILIPHLQSKLKR